jgi:hypothetical protein
MKERVAVVIVKEPEPYSRSGSAFRAYSVEDGHKTPMYIGGETLLETKRKVKRALSPWRVPRFVRAVP